MDFQQFSVFHTKIRRLSKIVLENRSFFYVLFLFGWIFFSSFTLGIEKKLINWFDGKYLLLKQITNALWSSSDCGRFHFYYELQSLP